MCIRDRGDGVPQSGHLRAHAHRGVTSQSTSVLTDDPCQLKLGAVALLSGSPAGLGPKQILVVDEVLHRVGGGVHPRNAEDREAVWPLSEACHQILEGSRRLHFVRTGLCDGVEDADGHAGDGQWIILPEQDVGQQISGGPSLAQSRGIGAKS